MATYLRVALVVAAVAAVCGGAKTDPNYKAQRASVLKTRMQFGYLNYSYVRVFLGIETDEYTRAQVAAALPPGADKTLGTPIQAVFFPRVDQFSLMRLNGTRGLVMANATVRAWVEVGGKRSEAKRMVVDDTLIGSRSVVVTLNRGNVTSIDWDDGCSECLARECLDGGCSLNARALDPPCNDPTALKTDPFRCAIKIYIAWIGTDIKGRNMQSVGKLPSRFYKYSMVSSVYDAAAGFWTDFLDAWSTPEQ